MWANGTVHWIFNWILKSWNFYAIFRGKKIIILVNFVFPFQKRSWNFYHWNISYLGILLKLIKTNFKELFNVKKCLGKMINETGFLRLCWNICLILSFILRIKYLIYNLRNGNYTQVKQINIIFTKTVTFKPHQHAIKNISLNSK